MMPRALSDQVCTWPFFFTVTVFLFLFVVYFHSTSNLKYKISYAQIQRTLVVKKLCHTTLLLCVW